MPRNSSSNQKFATGLGGCWSIHLLAEQVNYSHGDCKVTGAGHSSYKAESTIITTRATLVIKSQSCGRSSQPLRRFWKTRAKDKTEVKAEAEAEEEDS